MQNADNGDQAGQLPVVLHTQPTGSGYIAAHTHAYGTGKLPIPLADGRTFTVDLDKLPRPDRSAVTRSSDRR
jgi:hypothetical protein